MRVKIAFIASFILFMGCHAQRMVISKPKQVNVAGIAILVVGGVLLTKVKFKTN